MNPAADSLSQVDPPAGGLFSALAHLARPLSVTPVAPTMEGDRYATVPGRFSGRRDLHMDLYLPEDPAGAPSCVLVHGGGFLLGHRAMKPMCIAASALVRRGIAVASIDYRLLQHGGTFRTAVDDVLAALGHHVGRAGEFGLDPRRITVAGFSAGAALTVLAAGRNAEQEQGLPLAGIASVYGPMDFSRVSGRRAQLLARWITEEREPHAIRARSPISGGRFPTPLMVVHGTADLLVAPAQARVIVDERLAHGLPTRHVEVEGAPHGFFAHEGSPWIDHAIDALDAFVRDPGAA